MPVSFAALLVAGGRSTRMGYDKSLLEWKGRPLWQVQLEKLIELDPSRLLVACREEQELHRADHRKIEWMFDALGSDCGPMGPVLGALEMVQMPLLVLAVDMPHMTAGFLRQTTGLMPDHAGLFFALDHGPEPLAGVYVPEMLPLLRKAMAAGRFGLQRVIEQAGNEGLAFIQPLSEADAPLFANANTPEEWRGVL